MSQTTDNILYIPIQINGDGTAKPKSLLDRELYVLDNGTLYVGKKQPDDSIVITEVAGRVIPGATIEDAILKGKLKLDSSLIKTPSTLPNKDVDAGQIFFVDEGNGYK